jgi:DNA primase
MRDGRQAFFLFLPEGEDPDSVVRQEGAAGFDTRLATATSLSDFFFNEQSRDANLSSLEGKARLAERAKPYLASIPDGAFRDLMQQRLTELTGVGMRAQVPVPATPALRSSRGSPAPKQSLVRAAITFLLQQPVLAEAIEPPYLFAVLRQPGMPLLMELITLARDRPGIGTGAILEHFAEREEGAALQKLAMQSPPGDAAVWRAEFLDALQQLDRQTRLQRVEELRVKGSLNAPEQAQLRDLLGSLNR